MNNSVLKFKKNGIVTLPSFFNKEYCEKSVNDIEDAILKYPDKLYSQKTDGTGGDIRFFKFENKYETAKVLFDNEEINSIVKGYSKKDVVCHFIVAGKVIADKGQTINSGGGWHRDSDSQQIKVMIYLNNVDNENGPFQFIKESKKRDAKRSTSFIFNLDTLKKFLRGNPLKNPRYSDESIEKEIENKKFKVSQVEGEAGTTIIFDGSYVHRGKNISDGVRYSYTMYFYPNTKKYLKHTDKRFSKVSL
tara:strand:+ start:17959 stop:18702 length:744 start_codon:yes stop_codon:yes gene_type:complete